MTTNSYQQSSVHRSASLKRAVRQAGLLSLARKAKQWLKGAGVLKTPALDPHHYSALSIIDWERTLACVPSHSGFGGGYADIFVSEHLGAEALAELSEDLKRQVHPKTGKPLVDAIYTTEVFGSGPYAPREQHLLVLPSDGITFRVSLGNKKVWDEPNVVRGTHQKDGVLYAYGGGIKQGFKASNAEIYDLVPTVLRSMGLPFPCTFDGHVLDELFVEASKPAQEAAANTPTKGGLARRKLNKLLEV